MGMNGKYLNAYFFNLYTYAMAKYLKTVTLMRYVFPIVSLAIFDVYSKALNADAVFFGGKNDFFKSSKKDLNFY